MTLNKLPRVNLERWRPHVLAALRADQSFAAYARERQLSRHSLYVAHMHMKAAGEVAERRRPAKRSSKDVAADAVSAFVPVTLAPTAPALSVMARLPNGVCLECRADGAGTLYVLLQQLAALPCSG